MVMKVNCRFWVIVGVLIISAVFSAWGQAFRRLYPPANSAFQAVVEAPDGGFFLAGHVEDTVLLLQRVNIQGDVVWRVQQYAQGAVGVSACRADDGFAVLCRGFRQSGLPRNVVMRVDSSGQVLWTKVVENPSLTNGFHQIVSGPEGGFVLVGEGRILQPAVDFFARLVRLDAAGDVLWEQTFGQGNGTTELGRRVVVLPNGNIVLAGEMRTAQDSVPGGADFWMACTDRNGIVLWQQAYPKPAYQRFRDLLYAPDGRLVLLGETAEDSVVWLSLLETNLLGGEMRYQHPDRLNDSFTLARLIRRMACDQVGNLYIPFLIDSIGENFLAFFLLESLDNTFQRGKERYPADFILDALYTADGCLVLCGQGMEAGLHSFQAVLMKLNGAFLFNDQHAILSGKLYRDFNGNCAQDTDELEQMVPYVLVKAVSDQGKVYAQSTSYNGAYSLEVDPGSYRLYVVLPGDMAPLWAVCDTPEVVASAIGQSFSAPPIGLRPEVLCPKLSFSLNNSILRPCRSSLWSVLCRNTGTENASNVVVRLVADTRLTYVNSTHPLISQTGNIYDFDLGTLQVGDLQALRVEFAVSCSISIIGSTLCMEASVFPDTTCTLPDSLWDGSHLTLKSLCADSLVFHIMNTGAHMSGPCEYVIIEDQIMFQNGHILLAAGQDTMLTVQSPKPGASYYLRVQQRPGHPAGREVTAIVTDTCNGVAQESLALLLPTGDGNPKTVQRCDEVRAAFDPNDKRGFPLGWRKERFIEPEQRLEYVIRFQNTGNDTAFLVIIRDSLPPQLDPATLRPGPSSHPYLLTIEPGNVLRFMFPDIRLPDSTTNEPASHGFVAFAIAPTPNLPFGTTIQNWADIYFDFNAPIRTEPTFHTIGKPSLGTSTQKPTLGRLSLLIAPHPVGEVARIAIANAPPHTIFQFHLYDAYGRWLRAENFMGTMLEFRRQELPAGLYFFRLFSAEGHWISGRLLLH